MSTPDQPDTPALTRRQLREIRNTGATPVILPGATDDAAPTGVEIDAAPEAPTEPEPQVVAAPLAREAEPADIAPAPDPVDLGVAPLTRRQARQQERIRTASVPIITPDLAAAERESTVTFDAPAVISQVPARTDEEVTDDTTTPSVEPSEDAPEILAEAFDESAETAEEDHQDEADAAADDEPDDRVDELEAPADESDAAAALEDEVRDEEDEAPAVLVNPALGSELLAGEQPAVSLPPSFDQLIARSASATGSISAPNALILSQTPAGAPLVAPVTATGEVLITGTFELPDGLGSVGHAPGTADGKDLDVALIDGELPPASSPTPIAASAAISTVRGPGEEIIRPPAPEKGGRLMLALIITAGVLALALAGVLILALTTGALG